MDNVKNYFSLNATMKVSEYKPEENSKKFWLEDISVLFQTMDVLPNDNMSEVDRLNAMTRAIIILSVFMFIAKFYLWWGFLIVGFVTVIICWYIIKGRENIYHQTEYLRSPHNKIISHVEKKKQKPPSYHIQNQVLNIY